jgi:hypothetical protein
MKAIFLFILLISANIMFAQGKELATLDGKFSIVFPTTFSDPEFSSQGIESDAGELLLKMYTTSSTSNEVFVVSYNDYPDSVIVTANYPKMLDAVRDGALQNMKAKMDKQMDLTFKGNPARSVLFTSVIDSVTTYGRLDCFLVAPRLYQIIYLSPDKASRTSKDIKGVFSSFKLLTDDGEER